MRGQMPKPAVPLCAPRRHPRFRNAALGSRHYATRVQHPGAAPGQRPSAALGPPRPRPASHQAGPAQHCPGSTTPVPGPPRACAGSTLPHSGSATSPVLSRGCSGAQKQKIGSDCSFFAIRDCRTVPKRGFQPPETQQKRHISGLEERGRVRNRKKVATMTSFLFLQWVRSPQSGSSRENARDITVRRLNPETRKAPAMRTPPEKPIWLESTLPWHHTARNKHRAQPSAYRRLPLHPELRGCTGAR